MIGWLGSSSSASSAAGWLRRRPSRRATVSVPARDGGFSPARARATRISFAAPARPRARTSTRSKSVTLTAFAGVVAFQVSSGHGGPGAGSPEAGGTSTGHAGGSVSVGCSSGAYGFGIESMSGTGTGSGSAAGGANRSFRPATSAASSPCVSASSGRNACTVGAIRPARTTRWICGCAHERFSGAAEAAAATARQNPSRTTKRMRRTAHVVSAERRARMTPT